MNLLIDSLMLLLMAAITGIGLLMKLVLIPGQERWTVYGRNVDLSWLGLDRHGWGAVHFVLGCLLLTLIAWHLLRHWNAIVCGVRQLPSGDAARRLAVGLFTAFCLALLIAPFFIKPEVREIAQGEGRQARGTHRGHDDHEELRGSMTLEEASKILGVTAGQLKHAIGIPADTSDQEQLGRLRKKYGFRMEDVRAAAGDCGESEEACRPVR